LNTAWDHAIDRMQNSNRLTGPADPHTTGTKDAIPAGAFKALPACASTRIKQLDTLYRDAADLARASFDKQAEAQQKLMQAQQRWASATDPHVAAREGSEVISTDMEVDFTHPAMAEYDGDQTGLVAHAEAHGAMRYRHPEVREAAAGLEKTAREAAEIDRLHSERKARRVLLSSLRESTAAYVSQHASSLVESSPTTARVRKGESHQDALARLRDEHASLVQRLADIDAALPPKEELIAGLAAQVDVLAERGRPTITPDGIVTWPWAPMQLQTYGIASLDNEGNEAPVKGGAYHEVIDAQGLLAFVNRDALLAKLIAEIEARYDDDTRVMSREEKAKAAEALKTEILECERVEVALIDKMGEPMLLRPDTDARGLLGVDGPEPSVSL
jgi:hypothetical protein